jgi:hypothetical protein
MQPADDAPRVALANNNKIAAGTNNCGYDYAPVKQFRAMSCVTRSAARRDEQHPAQSASFNFTNATIWHV